MSKKPIVLTALTSAVTTALICFAVHIFTLSDIEKLKYLILNNYAGEITTEKLEEGAMRGMMEALEDPHSMYFNEEEFNMFIEEMDASYTGIGIEVLMKDDYLYVTSVFSDSPASAAGLQPDDIILKVNDMTVTNETYAEAITKMRSKDNTTPVDLTILRNGEELHFSISSDTIHLETVTTKEYDDITYIRIRSFDSPTAGEMATAIEKAEKRAARGLIIDVRDNPGGYLETVADIADMLLPKATIVYTKDKDGKQGSLYESDEDCITTPIAILVNENSASASEVLAGALKDNGRATVIGQKTYGKGSVQTMFRLRNGGAKITISHYYTAGGYIIDGNGIEPDYVVEKGDGEEDLQLEKALEILRAS